VVVAVVALDPDLMTSELLVAAALALPVIVTGMYVKSVPVYVSVLEPGKLASLPPLDSKHTAVDVPAREHFLKPVLHHELFSN
jgi:hypothetical protein